jgi:uncharacterized protein YbjT (DUF2867 family)
MQLNKVLVLGASGNIDQHMVNALKSQQETPWDSNELEAVRNINSSVAENFCRLHFTSVVKLDMLDAGSYQPIICGVTSVFLCTPQTFYPGIRDEATQY